MYRITTIILLLFFTISCKPKHIPEHGIETDRELMSRHIQCDAKKYKLVILDSIGYSKDSPYAFYYPDKYVNCEDNIIIISKLKANAAKKVNFAELYLGDHRSQTLYTGFNTDTLSFDYNVYHFDILKDTIFVNINK